jgi:DNA-binding NarL/FixJ family response regulator
MNPATNSARVDPRPVGLVLADGHPIVLQGMQHLFQAEPDLQVFAACESDDDTVDAVLRYEPDVLVLDLRLPRRGGLAVLRNLARRRLATKVVLLATSIREREMTEAVRLGAKGVVLKEMAPRFFVQCIRQVHGGAMWIENRGFGQIVERIVRCAPNLREAGRRLTPRELEIVQLVADGLRNKDITARLKITEGTVKIHLHNIYEKIGTNDRLQLALLARDEGLV